MEKEIPVDKIPPAKPFREQVRSFIARKPGLTFTAALLIGTAFGASIVFSPARAALAAGSTDLTSTAYANLEAQIQELQTRIVALENRVTTLENHQGGGTNGGGSNNGGGNTGGQGGTYGPAVIDQDGGSYNSGWDIYFTGRGFAPYEVVRITMDGTFVGTVQADPSGNISSKGIYLSYGTHTATFVGQTSGVSVTAVVHGTNGVSGTAGI